MLFNYVSRNGSKITWRKCCFDPKNLCDMLCSNFKIKIIPEATMVFKHDIFHAAYFCTKFEPPVELEIIKIRPLDEETEC